MDSGDKESASKGNRQEIGCQYDCMSTLVVIPPLLEVGCHSDVVNKIDIYSEKIITVQSSYQRSNVVLFYSIILSAYITLVRLGTGLFPCIGRQSLLVALLVYSDTLGHVQILSLPF